MNLCAELETVYPFNQQQSYQLDCSCKSLITENDERVHIPDGECSSGRKRKKNNDTFSWEIVSKVQLGRAPGIKCIQWLSLDITGH